jgi:hypothetical protein
MSKSLDALTVEDLAPVDHFPLWTSFRSELYDASGKSYRI